MPQQRELFDLASIEQISEDVEVYIIGAALVGLSAVFGLKHVVLEKGGEVGLS